MRNSNLCSVCGDTLFTKSELKVGACIECQAVEYELTNKWLEEDMIMTHDIAVGHHSDDFGEKVKVSGYFNEEDEWISYSRNDCCKNDLIEVGWYNEESVNYHDVEKEEDHGIEDAIDIRDEYKFYRCMHCGEVYPETEVIGSGMAHNYKKYNEIESEWDIAPNGRLPNGNPKKVNDEYDHKAHVGNNSYSEDYSDDENLTNDEVGEFGTKVADYVAYEPNTRITKECYKILKNMSFHMRIGKGVEYINNNATILDDNGIDVSGLLNVARCFNLKGWSKIRRTFAISADQRKNNVYSDHEVICRILWPEINTSGYFSTTLAPTYKKPYIHIYRAYKEGNDPKPVTVASKKYFIIDYYKSIPTAKEGSLVWFEYVDGQFVNEGKSSFMSNVSCEDANEKTLARCGSMRMQYEKKGYTVIFRDMDAICIKEHNITASRIAVRKLWNDIINYARMIKKTNYACIVK